MLSVLELSYFSVLVVQFLSFILFLIKISLLLRTSDRLKKGWKYVFFLHSMRVSTHNEMDVSTNFTFFSLLQSPEPRSTEPSSSPRAHMQQP